MREETIKRAQLALEAAVDMLKSQGATIDNFSHAGDKNDGLSSRYHGSIRIDYSFSKDRKEWFEKD